jgi:uncharacterized membrane protein
MVREPRFSSESSDKRPKYLAALAAVVLATFLLAPGDIDSKTHIALHGLCAQRPSHSLQIGGATLPLDARMTGIYIGAATSVLWLVAIGRPRATRTPGWPVLAVLAAFVVALGVDGSNALLLDLGWPHPYEPSNYLRIATGILGGTSLGMVLGYLFAASMWSAGDRDRSVIMNVPELLAPVVISGGIALLALADLPILYAPFAVGLLVAAVGVFWLLCMVVVALVSDRGWSSRTFADLTPVAIVGFIAAIVTVGALSWLRLVAEQFLGLPQLT